jgi:hypothetical protein
MTDCRTLRPAGSQIRKFSKGLFLALMLAMPALGYAGAYGENAYGAGVYGGVCSRSTDINSNGRVDAYDLSILTTRWNTSHAPADLDCSGTVDNGDLTILVNNWQGSL